MLLNTNDFNVKRAFYRFRSKGDIANFTQEAGIWIINFAKSRLKASDYESSEIFFLFFEKRSKFLSLLSNIKPRNIFPYLALNTKNILSNIRKKKDISIDKEYLKLWDLERTHEEDHIENDSRKFVHRVLMKIDPLERIAFSLRYNLKLNKKDSRYLEKIVQKRFPNPTDFYKSNNERVNHFLEKEKALIHRINYYSRRIYKNKNYEYKIDSQIRKKELLEILRRKEELFSLNEVGDLLQMSRYKVGKICKHVISAIRLEFEKNQSNRFSQEL